MADYKYGVYGSIGNDAAKNASQAGSAAVYFGTAPVNLLTGWADAGVVNTPVKISNLPDAQRKLGYFGDSALWSNYTLCEAIAAHFDNTKGNVGPIYVINVLDPEAHKKGSQTSKSVTFANRKVEIETDAAILDTVAIEGKVRGTDFTIEYDFGTGTLTVKDIGDVAMTSVSVKYFEVDFTKITAATVIGSTSQAGAVSGIAALKLLYQNLNVAPTYLAAPFWSDTPSVYNALNSAAQHVNGHWDAFVFADLSIVPQNIAEAKTWKQSNNYTSGNSKVFWPQVKSGDRVFHLSSLALAETLRCDMLHNDIPMETCGNKSIPATGVYLGADSSFQGYDQQDANELTSAGITTAIYWESNWRIWGDHTAAYTFGGSHKAREIFDTNMRMLHYVTNAFQKEWGTTIDNPMTLALKDTILVREQEKLDVLKAQGALIGNPSVEFLENNNPTTDMMNGDFRWDIAATPVPPLKSASVVVCYTDAGFSAYFGGDE